VTPYGPRTFARWSIPGESGDRHTIRTMAGSAEPGAKSELEVVPDRDTIMQTTAKLYGQGYDRGTIAKLMLDHLTPGTAGRSRQYRLKAARAKLRLWEHQQDFRDLVYTGAVVKLDLQSPAILNGLANRAKRGRVDAARLALELTGRHNPKGDQAPAQVALVISGVPRPFQVTAGESEVIVADEAMISEDEDV
jgi:hypothetical protein